MFEAVIGVLGICIWGCRAHVLGISSSFSLNVLCPSPSLFVYSLVYFRLYTSTARRCNVSPGYRVIKVMVGLDFNPGESCMIHLY